MVKELLQTQLEYSEWATRLLLKASEKLTPEEFLRDLGASHSSVGGTLLHILYGERAWTNRLVTNSLCEFDLLGDARSDPGPPLKPGYETLIRNWPVVWSSAREWLDGLSDEELGYELPSLRTDGTNFYFSRWQIVVHMVNHSTLHRGQVISMLRTLGKQPPNLDIFTFYWA